jgi:hypothetical protein
VADFVGLKRSVLPILAWAIPTLSCPLWAQPSPPSAAVPEAEHHYNPGARTVHTLYTCMDGHRAITMQYDQSGRGRVSSLARDGVLMPPNVVAEVNALLAHFDVVSSILPMCGNDDDTFFAEGMRNRVRVIRLIRWSPAAVSLDMSY